VSADSASLVPAKLSNRELYDLARRQGVRGRSLMTRDELVAALSGAESPPWG